MTDLDLKFKTQNSIRWRRPEVQKTRQLHLRPTVGEHHYNLVVQACGSMWFLMGPDTM